MNIDEKLKQLATTDWVKFCEVVGEDFILTARARILRKNGKSWQQISMTLQITPKVARNLCKEKPAQNGQQSV